MTWYTISPVTGEILEIAPSLDWYWFRKVQLYHAIRRKNGVTCSRYWFRKVQLYRAIRRKNGVTCSR